MIKPKVAILRTDGTNCDVELSYAFEIAGGAPELIHINELRDKSKSLKKYQIVALPGGFAYGDDIVSGKILAVELISYLKDQLQEYLNKEGLLLGVCNGFQALIRTGLLPFGRLGAMDATLAQNTRGHFECRWVKISPQKSKCLFLDNMNSVWDVAVNHGEGKIFASDTTIKKIEQEKLVAFRYVDQNGKVTQKYPQNPNGSVNAIAGLCDPTGRILGLMPHPEKFVEITQHPNWRRQSASWRTSKPHGRFLFENMVKFAKDQ